MLKWEANLQNAQRREIIMYHASAPSSNRSLTLWAKEKFSTSVSEMTISRRLKNKILYLGRVIDKPNSMRACKVLSNAVERATFAWFSLMEEKSTIISNDVLCSISKRCYVCLPRSPSAKSITSQMDGWPGSRNAMESRVLCIMVKRSLQITQKRQRLEIKRSKTILQPTTLHG